MGFSIGDFFSEMVKKLPRKKGDVGLLLCKVGKQVRGEGGFVAVIVGVSDI